MTAIKATLKYLNEILTDVSLIALSLDLLYLYYAGAWQEPNIIILDLEIALLFLIMSLGIYRLYMLFSTAGKADR